MIGITLTARKKQKLSLIYNMEFSLKQLSWIVIGSLGLGGTGYISMNNKIDLLATKVAVVCSQMEQQTKQLDRIEVKLNTSKEK